MDVNLAFLAAIVESSDDAIIGITPDGRIASWNSGANRIYGYTAAEVVGQSITILSLPERRDEIPLLQLRLRRGERVKHLQTLHLNKSGQMLQIYLSVSPIIDNSGYLLGASVISRDITERFHAEEALRETEEKYRLIFTAETDAILLFDATTGHLVDFNDAALKLYGYERDRFSSLTFSDLSTDFRPWESSSHGPYGTINRTPMTLHRRSDGTIFTAEMSTSPFVWQQRSMFVSIVRDITERVHSQKLIKSLAIAREIQQHLLPQQAPKINGLDIHARSISCEDIGGDYYDFFTVPVPGLPEPWFGFAIGDVSGHGIGAALLMGMAKGMLHGEVHNCGTDLSAAFASMNRHLFAATDDSSFLTLFFGLFDPVSRTLHWNSAGHGPVFWYRCRQGLITELLPIAPPLSIARSETFMPPPPVSLETGDILLLGTDGIWEACNPRGEMFEISRLRQLVATLAPKNAHQIHDTIMIKVFDFISGARPGDDMTLMVIKVVD